MANPEDLGRYRLKRLLGRGVLGEVWEASDLEQEGHKVAVKILHAADDELALARLQFAREARIAVHVHHPNIAQVRDAGEAAGTSFMVMEMVDGKPLRAVLADGTVKLEEKLRWLRQIGDALVTMHRADLVHRDLKPENVLIRPDRSAVIVDLGIAKWTKFDLGGERDPEDELGPSSERKGPDMTYAPPEAYTEESYDELGDQWAWGFLGYEILTGKRPEMDSPPLASREEIPKQIGDAIDKARSERREDRWDALEIALDEIGPGSQPIIRVEPSASRASTAPPPPSKSEKADKLEKSRTDKIEPAPQSIGFEPPPSSKLSSPARMNPLIIAVAIFVVVGVAALIFITR